MKFQKRLLIMVMVAVITISTIFTTSIDMRNVNASSIALPIAGIAVTLMAAYGISLFNGDSSAYDDQYWQNYYDDMEESYNKERSAKIAQFPTGGGDWDDEDGDGDKDKDDLPTWQEFSKVNNKQLNLSANGYLLGSIFAASFATTMFENSCVGGYAKDSGKVFNPAVNMPKNMSKLYVDSNINIFKGYNDFGCTNKDFLNELSKAYQSNSLLYTSKFISSSGESYVAFASKNYGSIVNSDILKIYNFRNVFLYSDSSNRMYRWGDTPLSSNTWLNSPKDFNFSSLDKGSIICINPNIDFQLFDLNNNIVEVDDSRYGMYVHPLLKDSYDKLKKVKLPKPCTTPLEVPDLSRIKEMTDAVDNPLNDPAKLKDLTTNFLEQIRPDLNPNFTPNPDPVPKPDPLPKPDPAPDPDPVPKPDFNPNNFDPATALKPLLADLKKIFPFCIPFDLIASIKGLKTQGKAPYWEIPFSVDSIGFNYTFIIDFNKFEHLAVVLRAILSLSYLWALMMITRQHMIKG